MSSEANSAAWNSAAQTASAGIAAIGQSVNTKKQYERSKELMELQNQNQETMNANAAARQLQMWKDTNYGAQVKEMQKAGLNVGMMYGGSGAGGSTVGSNSAGSAASGNPPPVQDIGAVVNAAKAAAELAMMKASTAKTSEEAESLSLDNKIRKEAGGYEADAYEASNRRDAALQKGQFEFENKEPSSNYEKGLQLDFEAKSLGVEMQKAVKRGVVSENEVKKYRAELAKAKIDPDSNPIVREVMKAMSSAGVPLSGILTKVVKMFK